MRKIKNNKIMIISYIVTLIVCIALGLLITKVIWESNLPIWAKIFLLR